MDHWSSVKFVNIFPVNKLRYKVVEFGGATSSRPVASEGALQVFEVYWISGGSRKRI